MAVLSRLSEDEIKREFDHYGLMFGIIPVYVGDPDGDCRIAVRNWVPEWTLDFVESLVSFVDMTMSAFNQHHEPVFAIKLTGEIK